MGIADLIQIFVREDINGIISKSLDDFESHHQSKKSGSKPWKQTVGKCDDSPNLWLTNNINMSIVNIFNNSINAPRELPDDKVCGLNLSFSHVISLLCPSPGLPLKIKQQLCLQLFVSKGVSRIWAAQNKMELQQLLETSQVMFYYSGFADIHI